VLADRQNRIRGTLGRRKGKDMGKHALPYDVEGGPCLYRARSKITSLGLARWAGYPISYTRAEGSYRSPERYYDYPSLACLIGGRATARLTCNGRWVELDTDDGSIGLFAPHTDIRSCRWESTGADRIIIGLDPTELDPSMTQDDTGLAAPLSLNLKFHDGPLLQLMTAIATEVELGCPSGKLYAESLCLGLTLYMRRNLSARAEPRAFERARLSARQLSQVDDYIHASLNQEITVDALAREVGLGKTHFMKLFKKTTGVSPYQYVMRLRVEHAQALMRQGRPLVEVAYASGFSSQSHFSSMFARFHGMPPSKFMHAEFGRDIPGFDITSV